MASDQELAELTSHCIRCGFCLESCPTYGETGDEMESPRGRIYLVRSAQEGRLRWQEDVRPHLENCLGCRACESACPSGVQYGRILEAARHRLESERPLRARRALLRGLTRPASLLLQLRLARMVGARRLPPILNRLIAGEAAQADLPVVQQGSWPSFESSAPVIGEVHLLLGCAMRVLFPRVHEATRRLLRRVGYDVASNSQGCCGALHAHSGMAREANARVQALERTFEGDLPIVVNSAGCGSWLKEQPGLRGRVFDISEFLVQKGLADHLRSSPGIDESVTYHDACHLAHGQGVRQPPRELIAAIPQLRIVELEESDMCCGSAGIYNLTQPGSARRLLDRKWSHIARTGARIVAMGNPGCHAWIAQAAREADSEVQVMHTAELLESSFAGLPARS